MWVPAHGALARHRAKIAVPGGAGAQGPRGGIGRRTAPAGPGAGSGGRDHGRRGSRPPRWRVRVRLHIEAELHHVAVLQSVALARYPHQFHWASDSGAVYLTVLASMLVAGAAVLARRGGT